MVHNGEATIGGFWSFSSPSLSLLPFSFICFLLDMGLGIGFLYKWVYGFQVVEIWRPSLLSVLVVMAFGIWWLLSIMVVVACVWIDGCWLGFNGVGERKEWRGKERLVLIYNNLLDNLYYCNELNWNIRNGI